MSNVWDRNGKGRMGAGLMAASLFLEREAAAEHYCLSSDASPYLKGDHTERLD